jgi:hypothetical protein
MKSCGKTFSGAERTDHEAEMELDMPLSSNITSCVKKGIEKKEKKNKR